MKHPDGPRTVTVTVTAVLAEIVDADAVGRLADDVAGSLRRGTFADRFPGILIGVVGDADDGTGPFITSRRAVRTQDVGGVEHRHEYQGQALVHKHPGPAGHGYYGHVEDRTVTP